MLCSLYDELPIGLTRDWVQVNVRPLRHPDQDQSLCQVEAITFE